MTVGAVCFGSAALVALIGVVLLAWALFADRSRGRKRIRQGGKRFSASAFV